MKNDFLISIETMHLDDNGASENIHDLSPEELAERKVVFIDIGKDPVRASDYKEEYDPAKYTSVKSGLGPLVGEWQKNQPVLMCAYKLVRVKFKWWGLQNRTEAVIIKRRNEEELHRIDMDE